jgi:hypothetical protein
VKGGPCGEQGDIPFDNGSARVSKAATRDPWVHPKISTVKLRALLALAFLGCPLFAVSAKFQDAIKVRIDGSYAVVLFSNLSKSMVPLTSLSAEDRAWLNQLSIDSPLAHGKSEVRIVKEVVKVKNTILVSTSVGPLETVQLNQPNVFRDQIDATCMLYARVHWLDIAGYYVPTVDIYKIINNSNPAKPWADPFYLQSLDAVVRSFTPRPLVHPLPPQADPFEWTRQELSKGRPILAAFPREIWQDLPPGFIAAHPWSGGSVGHQIVINGFTWNKETQQGTFHIVNSWKELQEFDLQTDAARGSVIIESSLSPKGEAAEAVAKTVVTKVTLRAAMGNTNLYEVETNLGTRRVAAPDEGAAKEMVESAN